MVDETGSHSPLTVARRGDVVELAWTGNRLVIPAQSFAGICAWYQAGQPEPAPAAPKATGEISVYVDIHPGM